jgi:hypothetical protein
MRRSALLKLALALVAAIPALALARHIDSLGFGNSEVSGFPHGGVVFVSGGGSYDRSTASNTRPAETFVQANGGFRCLESVTEGPLAGCLAGQGVRWDTNQLLASTMFRCTPSEDLRPAFTDDQTAVLLSDFYRAGDGNEESFQAAMIISRRDLDDGIPGVQNIWIQGVGCGTAQVSLPE